MDYQLSLLLLGDNGIIISLPLPFLFAYTSSAPEAQFLFSFRDSPAKDLFIKHSIAFCLYSAWKPVPLVPGLAKSKHRNNRTKWSNQNYCLQSVDFPGLLDQGLEEEL